MFLGNPKDILPKRPYSLQYNSTLWANQEGPGLALFTELAKTLPKTLPFTSLSRRLKLQHYNFIWFFNKHILSITPYRRGSGQLRKVDPCLTE